MEQAVVQVVENRADIDGRVLAVAPIAGRPDHRLVTIDVSGVSAVEGYPNLFASAPGTQLEVVLPAVLAETLQVGDRAPDAKLLDAAGGALRLFQALAGPHFTAMRTSSYTRAAPSLSWIGIW